MVQQGVEDRQHEYRPVLVQGEQHHDDEEREVRLGTPARDVDAHRGGGEQAERAGERTRAAAEPTSVLADERPAHHGARVQRRVPGGVALQYRVERDERGDPEQAASSRGAGAPIPRWEGPRRAGISPVQPKSAGTPYASCFGNRHVQRVSLTLRAAAALLVTLRADVLPHTRTSPHGRPRDRRLRRGDADSGRPARQRARLPARGRAAGDHHRHRPRGQPVQGDREDRGQVPVRGPVEDSSSSVIESGGGSTTRTTSSRCWATSSWWGPPASQRSSTGDERQGRVRGAIQAKDEDKLEDAIKQRGAEEKGEKAAPRSTRTATATLRDRGRRAGRGRIRGAAGGRPRAARRRRPAHRGGASTRTSTGCPRTRSCASYGDLQKLLAADPDTERRARSSGWTRCAPSGLTALVQGRRARRRLPLATDGGDLTDEDLPLAAGAESPAVIDRPDEIGVGLRDPAQMFRSARPPARRWTPRATATTQASKAARRSSWTSTSTTTSSASSRATSR